MPVRAFNAYISRVLTVAEHDSMVAERFFRVAMLQSPPTRLFRPATALRVLLGTMGGSRRPTVHAAAATAVPPPARTTVDQGHRPWRNDAD